MMKWMILGLGMLVCGCTGTQLNPEQQAEYDSLEGKKAELRTRLSAAQSKETSTFKRLGRLEARYKAVAGAAIGCGVEPTNQSFRLLFVHKKGYRAKLLEKGTQRVNKTDCAKYRVKVVK